MSLLGRQLQGTNRRSPPGTFVNAQPPPPHHTPGLGPTYAGLRLAHAPATLLDSSASKVTRQTWKGRFPAL